MTTPEERIANLNETCREVDADIARLQDYKGEPKAHISRWYSDIGEAVADAHNCTDLDLTGRRRSNKLTSFPDEIANLYHLERIYLSRNLITHIPMWLFDISSLASITLYDNKVVEIPEAMRYAVSLRKLDLSKNELSAIPEWFGELKALEYLDVSRNRITGLPSSMMHMEQLWYLNARCNLFTCPPEWIHELPKLINSNFEQGMPSDESESTEVNIVMRTTLETTEGVAALDSENEYREVNSMEGDLDCGR